MMVMECKRIFLGHLNGFKKVCCRKIFKINTLSMLLLPAMEAGHAEAPKWIQKGMLPRILQKTTYLVRLFHQPRKPDYRRLRTTLDLCINLEKESRRTQSRRSNGIKKVCYYEFIKLSTHSAHFFHQPPKLAIGMLNSPLDIYLKMGKGLRRMQSRQSNGI
jgi:hypothetical protein